MTTETGRPRGITALVPGLMLIVLGVCYAPPVARADLDYNFVEVSGLPVLNTTRTRVGEEIDLDGTGLGATLSIAPFRNWHLRFAWTRENQKSDNYLGLDNLGIGNRLEADRTLISLAPHFNYSVTDDIDIFLGLGVQFGQLDTVLVVDRIREDDSDTEFGVFVRGGARAMVWRGLELFGTMEGSNVAIVENELFFSLGGRYHFLRDILSLGISAEIGTNNLVGMELSGRVHYVEAWRALLSD